MSQQLRRTLHPGHQTTPFHTPTRVEFCFFSLSNR
jgi:hypothetical protein